jgi:hypothetical protein
MAIRGQGRWRKRLSKRLVLVLWRFRGDCAIPARGKVTNAESTAAHHSDVVAISAKDK